MDAPLEELLLIVNCPVACPAAVGLNRTFNVTDWFGFRVTGRVAPESVKAVPLSVAALIVSGAVPDEVNVNGSVALLFTDTLPKDSEFDKRLLLAVCKFTCAGCRLGDLLGNLEELLARFDGQVRNALAGIQLIRRGNCASRAGVNAAPAGAAPVDYRLIKRQRQARQHLAEQ